MSDDAENPPCCGQPGTGAGGFKIEALVSIDDRGQMVLPKDIRDKAGIKAGDKLVVVGFEQDNKLCCISLIKTEELTDMVKNILGPMKDLL